MIGNSELQSGKRSLPIVAVSVILYALATLLSLELIQIYQIPSDRPGGAPPWYFIRQDAIHGMCFLLYFLVCLAIGAWASWRKMAGGMTLIWFNFIPAFQPVWMLCLILLKTDDIFDPETARTSWMTFDSYTGDPLRWGWLLVLLAVGIIVTISMRRKLRR
jgi:hypothetical protein